MTEDGKDRLSALYVDSDRTRLRDIRSQLDSCRLDIHQVSSMKQAQESIARRSYGLVLIRFAITTQEDVHSLCFCFHFRNPRGVVVVLTEGPDPTLEGRLFDCGASDVVNMRQSSPSALAKRIRAHLCKSGMLQPDPRRIQLGDAIVDFERREVHRNQTVHQLPGILADLLRYFIDNADHVVSREELQESPIWLDSICTPAKHGGKTFDVTISKLRKIIEPDPHKPTIIVSVRGVGWKLASETLRDASEQPDPR